MNSVHLTGVALAALLSENFILVNCMGIGTQFDAFHHPRAARRTGCAVMLSMVVTVFFTWLVDVFILLRYGLEQFRLMAFTLIAMGCVAGLRTFFKVFLPELSNRLDDSLAAMPTNCSALGAALLISIRGFELGQAMTFALFGGLGVLLVVVCLAGLRDAVSFEECPRVFRGMPMLLITLGLMALALVGFYGLHI